MLFLFVLLFTSRAIQCHFNTEDAWDTLYVHPEQIHLSVGTDETEMIVTWSTLDLTAQSTVWYGIYELNLSSFGTVHKFVDGGEEKRHIFMHRVKLTGLIPGQSYKYHCGSDDGWSPIFFFTTWKKGSNWIPKLLFYGDLGNDMAKTLGRLQDEVQRGMYDAIFHIGDFAYDLHVDNGKVGDEFMRQIEPMAAYLPYQVCHGNHDHMYNFSHYDNRFSMISKGNNEITNHYWSQDIGSAHIIALSTELYYFPEFGTQQIENQYKWLEQDLIEANKPENRAQRPWIITMGHRPLYAQNHIDDLLRLGYVFEKGSAPKYGLEELLYKHGVDLEFWAHEHNYERFWPIYNNTIYNGSLTEPYTNPKAPVQIISGSAGSREKHTRIHYSPYYSALRFEDYGYTRLNVINNTHLYLEQVSTDKHGELIDKLYLIKDKHGFEAWI